VRGESLETLRRPACGGRLSSDAGGGDIESARLICDRGHDYDVRDGLANLVHPRALMPSAAEFKAKYDVGAEDYDSGIQWMRNAFSADEDATRAQMIDLLELAPGMRVLETGCGTGQDSWRIIERLGDGGELYATDLSPGMLRVARRRLAGYRCPHQLVLCNGSYLPFADDEFDAAYHFGGINTFGERRRALLEMARVLKSGGRVVFGDEGIAPWQRRKRIGKILINANPLHAHAPPLAELPPAALDVRLRWIISNAFYAVDHRVGDAPPPVDLDPPIPGKGDHGSRYYGST
jgi:ubiquinone/menaquinone biosynthesis C-methylase UbiE